MTIVEHISLNHNESVDDRRHYASTFGVVADGQVARACLPGRAKLIHVATIYRNTFGTAMLRCLAGFLFLVVLNFKWGFPRELPATVDWIANGLQP